MRDYLKYVARVLNALGTILNLLSIFLSTIGSQRGLCWSKICHQDTVLTKGTRDLEYLFDIKPLKEK